MKNNNGITLIALIVTIITLIILAAVSINILFGENGLINRTKVATMDYKVKEKLEELELIKAEIVTEKQGKVVSKEEYVQKLIEK